MQFNALTNATLLPLCKPVMPLCHCAVNISHTAVVCTLPAPGNISNRNLFSFRRILAGPITLDKCRAGVTIKLTNSVQAKRFVSHLHICVSIFTHTWANTCRFVCEVRCVCAKLWQVHILALICVCICLYLCIYLMNASAAACLYVCLCVCVCSLYI